MNLRFGLSGALALAAASLWTGVCSPAGAIAADVGGVPARVADTVEGLEDRAQAVQCLTDAIYYEAATEPLEGREGVAQVVLNRLRSSAYPKTICGVVFEGVGSGEGCQFTFACDGSMIRRPVPRLWSEAQAIAEAVLGGRVPSWVGDATHYHAYYVSPTWEDSMVETARIGAHLFYRRADKPNGAAGIAGGAAPALPRRPTATTFSPWGLEVATIVPSGQAPSVQRFPSQGVGPDVAGVHSLGD